MTVRIKVIKPFTFAYGGIKPVHYAPGEHSVSERCAAVAIEEGWAKKQPAKTGKKGGKS